MVVGGIRGLFKAGLRSSDNLDDVGRGAGASDNILKNSRRGDDLTNQFKPNLQGTTPPPPVRRFSFRNTALVGGGGFLLGATAGDNTLGNAVGNPLGFVGDALDSVRNAGENFSETTGNFLEGAGNLLLLGGLAVAGYVGYKALKPKRKRGKK